MPERSVVVDQLQIAGRTNRSPRKLALLNTAITLFADRGYNGVTIRDIGDAMGMTSASLYRHYASKEALLADAIDLVIQPMLGEVAAIYAREGTPLDRLTAAVQFHAEFALKHRTYLRVYFVEAKQLGPDNLAAHMRLRNRYRDLWLDLLRDADAASTISEARELYSLMIVMLNLGGTRDLTLEDLDWVTGRTMALLMARMPPLAR